jgi:hypothetical protein
MQAVVVVVGAQQADWVAAERVQQFQGQQIQAAAALDVLVPPQAAAAQVDPVL